MHGSLFPGISSPTPPLPHPQSAYMIAFSKVGPLPFSCHYCFYLSTSFPLWHLTQLVIIIIILLCSISPLCPISSPLYLHYLAHFVYWIDKK